MKNFIVCSWDTASFAADEHRAALESALQHTGASIVETCQRVEAISLDSCPNGCESGRTGEDAFRYLVRLAAGLESIVLGETEIVGQLREAARRASPEVSVLIGRAIAAARAFRREQQFRADSGHLLDLALAATGEQPKSLVVVGSGPTTRCLVRRASGQMAQVRVTSRTRPAWISGLNVDWAPLEHLDSIESSDMAIVALGRDAPVLCATALRARLVVDISTPRRTALDSAGVITLRHLRSYVATAEANHRADLRTDLDRRADRALAAWAEDGNSAVGRFRHSAELVRREELERLVRRYPEIDRETLEVITRTLTNKLLHAPSVRMRSIDCKSAELVAGTFDHQTGVTTRWQD